MADGILREVEEDAIHIQTKRFKDQEEERQYNITKEASKETKKAKLSKESEQE